MLGSTSQISTVESFSSISYLEGYLENADYLPSELQYYVTHYRELACQMKEVAADIVKYHEAVLKSNDASQKKQAVLQIQRCLIRQNELGDQKLDILATMGDLIENKVREIEIDDHIVDVPSQPNIVNLVREEEIVTTENHSKTSADVPTSLNTRSSNNHGSKVEEKPDTIKRKRHGRHRSSTQQEQICAREEEKKEEEERPKKKKARKDKVVERCVKIIGNIDPNEPVYCSCREVSYGEMIGCDNDNCAIEWFHFRCVDLTHKPKGKWFCPTCRGDRQNVMNPELVEQQRKAKKNASSAASGTCGD